ncbi:MAG: uroporphyrinogen-III synthase [Amaricoccus sp.]
MARTLLLTRPRAQSEAFAREVEARMPGRFVAVVAPVIAIAPVAAEVELEGVGGLVFTSANGVERFAALTAERGLPAWCVGAMTAAAARRAGFAARSAGGDVEALAAMLAAEHRAEEGVLLHVRGRHAAGDLLGRLAAAGVAARAAEVYEQAPVPLPGEARALLAGGRADVVAFFSPRSAAAFAAEADGAGWNLAGAAAVSLSAAADAGLGALGFGQRRVAAAPTREGMLEALAAV